MVHFHFQQWTKEKYIFFVRKHLHCLHFDRPKLNGQIVHLEQLFVAFGFFVWKLTDLQSVSKAIGFDVKQVWSMENKSDLQKWATRGRLQKIGTKFNDNDNVIGERKKKRKTRKCACNLIDSMPLFDHWSVVTQKNRTYTNGNEVVEPIMCVQQRFPEKSNSRKTCTILTCHQLHTQKNQLSDNVFYSIFFLVSFHFVYYDSVEDSFIN